MKNTSGIEPVEFNVLVKQDAVQDKTSTGIYLPEETKDRDRHGETNGVLVAISGMAFNEDIWPQDRPKPQAGQRIAFAKHSGTFVEGMDGEEYRVIKDKDVVALIEVKND